MLDVTAVTNIVGVIIGVLGGATGVVSLVNQRRQTQIMEVGLERAFETPESSTGKAFERKIREVINRRLSDTRAKMRQEFEARINPIEQELKAEHITEYTRILLNLSESLRDGKTISELAEEAKRIQDEILADQERIVAKSDRNSSDIAVQGLEIGELQRQLEIIQQGIAFHDSVLKQMRWIAEQMMQITNPREITSQSKTVTMIVQDDAVDQSEKANYDEMVTHPEVANEGEMAGQDAMTGQDWMASQYGIAGQADTGY